VSGPLEFPVVAEPTHTAIGAWSGGRFMHFGESIDEDRLTALLRPDDALRTVITADVYGCGDADRLVARALAGLERSSYSLVGAVGHDFYEGERGGPRGFPRFTDPALRGPEDYGGYVRMAVERSLERCGVDSFDLLLLHNPDRAGYTSREVWDALAAVRDEGLAGSLGVAPGPANGFTLDLIECFERFGELVDWAMVILNPLEPWPGELALPAAAAHDVRVLARVVDYGGLFWDDLVPGSALPAGDHRGFRPEGWVEAGRERMEAMRPIAARHGLTMLQLACLWDLAQEAVACVAPTLIQEAGPEARRIEDKRAELAALPSEQVLDREELDRIRSVGDNTGCMTLKGGVPDFEGEPRPDRWPLSPDLERVAERWGIEPARDLAPAA
jgi:aryl-alcohol dehydrogenase-like predicted oxidoreductase